MENHTNYLVEKTDCILYYAEPSLSNEQGTGWIGGMHRTSLMIKQTLSTKVIKNIIFTCASSIPLNRRA